MPDPCRRRSSTEGRLLDLSSEGKMASGLLRFCSKLPKNVAAYGTVGNRNASADESLGLRTTIALIYYAQILSFNALSAEARQTQDVLSDNWSTAAIHDRTVFVKFLTKQPFTITYNEMTAC